MVASGVQAYVHQAGVSGCAGRQGITLLSNGRQGFSVGTTPEWNGAAMVTDSLPLSTRRQTVYGCGD